MTPGKAFTVEDHLDALVTRASEDRRSNPRHYTVLQTGKIVSDTLQDLCLIKNISANGVMARVYSQLKQDEELLIEFKGGRETMAKVVWTKNRIAGLKFASPVDPVEIFAPRQPGFIARAPRLDIEAVVHVDAEGEHFFASLMDLSQNGAKIETRDHSPANDEVELHIEGLPDIKGRIRWSGGGYSGIAFDSSLKLDQLACWAAGQPPRKRLSDIVRGTKQGTAAEEADDWATVSRLIDGI